MREVALSMLEEALAYLDSLDMHHAAVHVAAALDVLRAEMKDAYITKKSPFKPPAD